MKLSPEERIERAKSEWEEIVPSVINPSSFVKLMKDHWTERLGNVSNPALKQLWHSLAQTFGSHIYNHGNPEKAKLWNVLPIPTGGGKTESTVMYCAAMSKYSNEKHAGVLIVTRLKSECERLANRINKLGHRDTAIAFHSGSDCTHRLKDLWQHPVLVITHRAYEIGLERLGKDATIEGTWKYFHRYNREGVKPVMVENPFTGPDQIQSYEYQDEFYSYQGSRRLCIVDEALDIIEHHRLGLNSLQQALGAIPNFIRKRHPEQINYLKAVIDKLEELDDHPRLSKEFMVDGESDEAIDLIEFEQPDLQPLIEDLSEIQFDIQIGKNDDKENRRLRERYQKMLKDLQMIYQSWRYFSKRERELSLNSARVIMPDGVKGAVVLDATAETNLVYRLHKDSDIEDIPKGSRDYSNVTLHISRGHKVGKWHMIKNARHEASKLISNLNKTIKGRKAFVVCHKHVEPVLRAYDPKFNMKLSHWGAFDGSNEYQGCDVAVIFGLKYLPKTWSSNVFMAFQGSQTTEWLQNNNGDERQWRNIEDIRKALDRSALSIDIIQAINRIKCRKVVDSKGNCDPCDIYLMLPSGKIANQILKDIKDSMPNIQTVKWDFDHNKRGARRSKFEEALVTHFKNMKDGQRQFSRDIIRHLGMSSATFERLAKKCRSPESKLSFAMKEYHVRYVVEGVGRGSRSYFVKD